MDIKFIAYRTIAEKQADVKAALQAPETKHLSSTAIAEMCAVSVTHVQRMRPTIQPEPEAKITGSNGRNYPSSQAAVLAQRARIAEEIATGGGDIEIAAKLGCSNRTVWRVRKNNFKPAPAPQQISLADLFSWSIDVSQAYQPSMG